MAGVNKVILVGNVGKDPEIRNLEGGARVAKFPLATSESYKKADGTRVETTEWHNIVLWRGLADIAERFVHKGSQLYIEGKIRSYTWNDKEGVKRYSTEIVGENMTLLGKRPEDANTGTATQEYTKPTIESPPISTEPQAGDDLPF